VHQLAACIQESSVIRFSSSRAMYQPVAGDERNKNGLLIGAPSKPTRNAIIQTICTGVDHGTPFSGASRRMEEHLPLLNK